MQIRASRLTKLSLRQPPIGGLYEENSKVLINRQTGGLGDILMHRMLFEDFKNLGVELHFACPPQYHAAVHDHPFLDQVLDSEKVDQYSYPVFYDTTTCCGRYEVSISPRSDLHRSDIWARYCGITLSHHDMHIRLTENEVERGRELVWKLGRGKATVAVCPVSAQVGKNLEGVQVINLLNGLRDLGFVPFGLHTNPINEVEGRKIPMVSGIGIRDWMGVINAVDYVVAVDTAAFHLAGGMGKPTVGVFSFVNGSVYSKYYPRVEVVQGPCPEGYQGCYNWVNCPVPKINRKPCITGLGSNSIMEAFERLVARFPR